MNQQGGPSATTWVIVTLFVAILGFIGAVIAGVFQGAGTQAIFKPGDKERIKRFDDPPPPPPPTAEKVQVTFQPGRAGPGIRTMQIFVGRDEDCGVLKFPGEALRCEVFPGMRELHVRTSYLGEEVTASYGNIPFDTGSCYEISPSVVERSSPPGRMLLQTRTVECAPSPFR
jgi:hypothetical protein